MLVWGVIATAVMVSIMAASQDLGWSRLSMSFLLGAAFTSNRRGANVVGAVLYFIGGWLFAFFYYLFFSVVGTASAWLGAIVGLVHGVLLLTILLPLMPYMHPRMASEYDGPSSERRLEPPGFLALHYGSRTPLAALLAHVLYGAILGYGFRV
jgi:uncharacterized membrane protein YagU involved in acid resistance